MSKIVQWLRSHPVWTAVVALGLLAAVFLSSGGGSVSAASATHSVTRGDFLVSIVEGGTLEAVNEVVVRNEVDGDSRIIYIIPEGTYIKEGDLLVELDGADAEEELKDQLITFETSRASFVTADNGLVIMKSTVDSETRAAELAVTFAQMDLEKFEQLDKTQQLRTAELDIDTAAEALKLAEQTYEWSKKLAERGFETKSQVDRDALDVSRSSKQLETATSTRTMLREYDLAKFYAEFKSVLEEAEKELIRVKKQGESKIAQAQADRNSAEATLKLNEDKLSKMKEQLKFTKVYAPQDGLVVYAMTRSRSSSESLIEEGAQVRKRQELIKIPDTSSMKVEIKVHESHVGQVRVDQPAFVVLDSLPDQRFRGKVTKVAILPDSQSRWGNPNLKVYTTEIVITDDMPDVKPGVSARAEIVVTNLKDVLTVPIQCVTTIQGQQVCYVKKGGNADPEPVKIGMFNSKSIEIEEGLKEGDRVLLAPPLESDIDLSGGVVDNAEEGLDLPSERPAERKASPAAGRTKGGGGGSKGGGDQRAAMMKRFDKDGDGKLSAKEKAAIAKEYGGGGESSGGGRPKS